MVKQILVMKKKWTFLPNLIICLNVYKWGWKPKAKKKHGQRIRNSEGNPVYYDSIKIKDMCKEP